MKPIALGPGLAPDLVILGGVVYVAYGAQPDAVTVVALDRHGTILARRNLPDGFYNSFPRFCGWWVGYKTHLGGFVPRVEHLQDGRAWLGGSAADGNWPLFVTAGNLYWQTGAAFDVMRLDLATGEAIRTGQRGAPDGIERLDGTQVVCRKDIRLEDPEVGGYPSHAGDLTVGQYGYGIGVRLDGEAVRWIAGDPSDDHPDPRGANEADLYAWTCWGQQGVRVYIGIRADILALPLTSTEPQPEPPDPEPPDPEPPDPEPPDPQPEPPKPEPEPPSPYRRHQQEANMEDTIGVLRGPGGRLARANALHTGPWAGQGWRGLVFDGTNDQKGDPRYHFLRPADAPTALVGMQTGAVIGCDATLHSGALDQQFYMKPDGDRGQGWAETWQFYDGNHNGAIQAQVEYGPGYGGDDGAFFSYPLAFEAL